MPVLPVSRQKRAEPVLAVRVMRRYGKSLIGRDKKAASLGRFLFSFFAFVVAMSCCACNQSLWQTHVAADKKSPEGLLSRCVVSSIPMLLGLTSQHSLELLQ